MDENRGSIIGFFIYFWMFEIAAFVVFFFMGLVSADSSVKTVLILFLIIGMAYVGMYLIRRNGIRKRAAFREREASAAAVKKPRVHKKK